MRVALIGSHNTGKTTVFEMLKRNKDLAHYYFAPEPTHEIVDCDFKINAESTDCSQLAMLSIYMENMLPQNSIQDRCILDNYVYALYLHRNGIISNNVVRFIWKKVLNHIKEYDYFFYFPIKFPLQDNNFRSVNKEFQEEIDKIFRYVLFTLKEKFQLDNIYFLEGDSKQRLETILNVIASKLSCERVKITYTLN